MADELEKGTRIRRSILGDAHVDRSWAATTWFSAPFQEYVTRNVWEEVWGQPTMAPGVRRLMTLCMLSALNRGEEYKLHVRAALDAGLTVADLREVVMMTLVYAGVPAANSAIKWAEEVFEAHGIDVESLDQQRPTFAP
jgi:alkylhydroperoxidase/carboxymuconolactone decarboxylase family protein YurZ